MAEIPAACGQVRKAGHMTASNRAPIARTVRSRRYGARAALAVACTFAAALSLAGCSESAEAGSSPASDNAPALAVIQEQSAAEVAAEAQAQADETARDAAVDAGAAAKAQLDQAVADIEAKGAVTAYIALDMTTGQTVEYNADQVFYSASSIKGPFCVSLMRAHGAQARERYAGVIRACLVNSSNDDYDALRQAYRRERFFQELGREAGVSADLSHWYADYSVRDLARIWTVCGAWLAAGGEDAAWVGELLSDTLNSQVDDCAGGEGVTTWSKAGWFPDGDEPAVTIDGGVVHTEAGDYAIAVAVNRGSDFKAIRSVMEPLVTVYRAQALSAE